jgi:hypothetical protein
MSISISSEENLQHQEAATKYEAIITKNFYQKEQKAHFYMYERKAKRYK